MESNLNEIREGTGPSDLNLATSLASKGEQTFEINQNYLKPFIENPDSGLHEESSAREHVDKNDVSNGTKSNKIGPVEKTSKVDGRIVLCVKKKPSFLVNAILEADKSGDEMQNNTDLETDILTADRLVIDERNAETDNHVKPVTDNRQSTHDNEIVHTAQNCAQIVTRKTEQTIRASHNGSNEDFYEDVKHLKSDEEPAVEDVVTPVLAVLSTSRTHKMNNSDDLVRNFESKIDEIRKRKEREVQQVNNASEEKKVRKRKQERPQFINAKQRHFELDSGNEASIHSNRKSKRKQTVTKRHFLYDTDSESENSNEIKQTPLCSKLCSPDFRKTSAFRKRNVIHLTDIEENSQSEDSNIPCTTNRYRRHFLKQLRNTEVAKSNYGTNIGGTKERSETSFDESKVSNAYKDYDSDDDYFFDGKRIKVSEVEQNVDFSKCRVCAKEFSDIGTLMAHYICHSSLEKEQADLQLHPNINPSSTVETSTYFCHLCNQKYTDIAALQEHVMEHSINLTTKQQGHFECSICKKTFATAGSLYLHKKVHTGENPYTCRECHKHFRDKTRLTTHMRVHTGEKPFTCELCSKNFSQKGNLKLHQQKIHYGLKRGKFRCRRCSFNFSDKNDLKEHMKKIHHENKASNSEKASLTSHSENGNESSQNTNLESADRNESLKHVKSDTKNIESSKKGNRSSASVTSSVDEKQNPESINTDTDEQSASVDTCTNAFENADSSFSENSSVLDDSSAKESIKDFRGLFSSGPGDVSLPSGQENLSFIESSKPAKFTCPVCSLPFQTATSFNRHFLTHGNTASAYKPVGIGFSMIAQSGSEFPSGVKKVYRCEECSLDFVSFPEFQSHLKSHKDNSSKVMCNICQKQMSSSNLLDHMRIHTGEKPYSCVHCGKLFRRSHHLQTHLRTHTGDRPYVCVDCGKTFARGDHLQNHRRTHTGEKPYKCEICDKSYSQSHHLLRHKRTHTGEKPYNCEMCDKKFSRDHHLKKHMETHRVVIYTTDKEGASQKNPNRQAILQNNPKMKIELPSSPMATRGSDRIAQLLSSSWYNNIASELMAGIVQKHITAQKEPLTQQEEKLPPKKDSVRNKILKAGNEIHKPSIEELDNSRNADLLNNSCKATADEASTGSVTNVKELNHGSKEVADEGNDAVDNLFLGEKFTLKTGKEQLSEDELLPPKETNFSEKTRSASLDTSAAELETKDSDTAEVTIKDDKIISFMDQLRAISMASTLGEIVKQRLNEDFGSGIVGSEKVDK